MLKFALAIEEQNSTDKSDALDFKELYEGTWNNHVSSVALSDTLYPRGDIF